MDAPIKLPNYEEDVDFEALALQDADFAKVLSANGGILDFHDPQAVKYVFTLIKRFCFKLPSFSAILPLFIEIISIMFYAS